MVTVKQFPIIKDERMKEKHQEKINEKTIKRRAREKY